MGKISDDEMNIPIIFRNVKYQQELPSLCCTDCIFVAGKFFEENLNNAIESSLNKRWNFSNFFREKNIIIIGQGAKAKENIQKIKNLI